MQDNHTFVQYIVNVDGVNFEFVDVPSDGNCYYHCILKQPFLSEQFDTTDDIRSYLSQSVQSTYNNDSLLRKIFYKEKVNHNMWCLKILKNGEWAESIDQLICSYILNFNAVVVGNFEGRLSSNNMQTYLEVLTRSKKNIAIHGTIHIFHHVCGNPLIRCTDLVRANHFAYLHPVSENSFSIESNTIRQIIN